MRCGIAFTGHLLWNVRSVRSGCRHAGVRRACGAIEWCASAVEHSDMQTYDITRDATGVRRMRVARRGQELLRDPLLNKGTAFTDVERGEFGLEGLLPAGTNTLEQQARRIYASIAELPEPLQRYAELTQLQDRNEHLFYKVLTDHLEMLMPIVYTPTVGLATRRFSQVFRRGRGLWITPAHRGRMRAVLRNAAGNRHVRLMVVTDNESILGIGDQGAGGMAISVGKLSLYTAGAGVHPGETLPISFDVGTDNETLLADDLYLGWRQKRLRGGEYMALLDEFIEAVADVLPGALVQWEDFRKDNALSVLERFRGAVPSFNDDIQGTGAVALAGVETSMRVSGISPRDQRILIYGAGAAGLGIARQLRAGLLEHGLSRAEVERAVAVMDSRGLLVADRPIHDAYKVELSWSPDVAASFGLGDPQRRDLLSVVEHYRPTVLIGSSGQGGAFTEPVIRALARHTQRPVVLPFSNPTDNCEAQPRDVLAWTDGRALVATGSPFAPVEVGGRHVHIGQGNNAFIFPGLGLGTLACGARTISDEMIAAAAAELARCVRQDDVDKGYLFPPIARLRDVSRSIARAVVMRAVDQGNATLPGNADVERILDDATWSCEYPAYDAV
jgi:malic enzyme